MSFTTDSVKTPQEIVKALDEHIVGQDAAKRSVAIALRNRHRRMQVSETLRNEISPKNILMIGDTGVGKTEIARRLAKLANAPFIKTDCSKFTEVGYVGRDVESIIRELMDVAVKMTREEAILKVKETAEQAAEERILDALLPGSGEAQTSNQETRQVFRKKFREGQLDDKEIEIEVQQTNAQVEIMAPPGMEEMTHQLQGLFQSMSGERMRLKKMHVKDAYKLIRDEEASKLINDEDIKSTALKRVEQNGIVFLDEIDKITQRSDGSYRGGEVSREGVQRDLLPLIEGSTVSTKYGMVKTDHILFIASGAFHLSKPSDLIPELQGRLPIRVQLKALKVEDFVRILTEPSASLITQYQALLKTEGITLNFEKGGVKRIAEIAAEINERTANIGARRLHTVLERLLEEVSFSATEMEDKQVKIDVDYVNKHLESLSVNDDLSRFIL